MLPFRVATWNVNSIRVRLDQVLGWIDQVKPDVLCLQETKAPVEAFPSEAFRSVGFEVGVAGQKSYNGVAILSRVPLWDVTETFEGDPDPSQKRFISASAYGVRIVNAYVPNGSEVDSPKFAYKLAFIRALRRHLDRSATPADPLLLVGDFNVARDERDVYDPAAWEGDVLYHPQARAALSELFDWGFVDLFRRIHHAPGHYTWWDYRQGAFPKNHGLRIDHIWASEALAARAADCRIDVDPRRLPSPSDHAPVVADFR